LHHSEAKEKLMQKKITLWSLASVLVLLLGICTTLFPSRGSVAQAASVRIDDKAGVLEVNQVRDAASKLSQPVYISTIPTFSGSKSEFTQSVQQMVTDQKMIAIGISTEQRYLAIVAGTQADINADQISKARQAFRQAYGENAGANGNYTAATQAALQSLQSSGEALPGSDLFSFGSVFGIVLLVLIPLLLIGLGVFVSLRLFARRKPVELPKDMPHEQSYTPEAGSEPYTSDDGRQLYNPNSVRQPTYASRFHDGRNTPIPGDGGIAYAPTYPQQQRGMNPWVAGGLGALGGGLLGYGLGQAASGNEQVDSATAYASEDAVPVDVQGENYPDFGGFGSDGADFGGDFGGDSW
jgi:hypothetical protein